MSIDASVIIPAYNKREDLELTLAAFNHQSFPNDRFEVIVVDDGSTDGTEDTVAAFDSNYSLVYKRQLNAGRSAARNSGINKARGRILVFCDADAIPDQRFIEHHARHHTAREDAVVLGCKYDALVRWNNQLEVSLLSLLQSKTVDPELKARITAANPPDPITFLTKADIERDPSSIRNCVYGKSPHNGDAIYSAFGTTFEGFAAPWLHFVTTNASILKSHIDRIGLFDESFSGWGMEDTELGYRLFKGGGRFIYEEYAATFHQTHYVDHKRQRSEEARNFALFCVRHPALEVYLFWRVTRRKLSATKYNELVGEYYGLRESGLNRLADDYLDHAKKMAYDFAYRSEFPQFSL
jgi:glycosyltransferase involved in cell wall biosynthesis